MNKKKCIICKKDKEEFLYINGMYICYECSFQVFLHHAKELSKLKPVKRRTSRKSRFLSDVKITDFEDPKYCLVTKRFYELFQRQVKEDNSGIQDVFQAKEDQIVFVQRMYERDKRTADQIKHAYHVLETNAFWRLKVRSMSKLRDQMDKLLLEKLDDKVYKQQLTGRALC